MTTREHNSIISQLWVYDSQIHNSNWIILIKQHTINIIKVGHSKQDISIYNNSEVCQERAAQAMFLILVLTAEDMKFLPRPLLSSLTSCEAGPALKLPPSSVNKTHISFQYIFSQKSVVTCACILITVDVSSNKTSDN